jgi:hypothetical protein
MINGITALERKLCEALASGGQIAVDVQQADDVVSDGAQWPHNREVRAPVLTKLLAEPSGPAQSRSLRLAGARIVGALDLRDLTLPRALELVGCFSSDAVLLDYMRGPRLVFDRCSLARVSARHVDIRGNLVLRGLVDVSRLDLDEAKIGGNLVLTRTQLLSDGAGMTGNHLDVSGQADFSEVHVTNSVRLRDAHIGGNLAFMGASLIRGDGPALEARGVSVEGGMWCWPAAERRFEAEGGVRLEGAHVSGELNLSGAKLTGGDRPALEASGLRVDLGMICRPAAQHRFEANGGVRLNGAHVSGELNLSAAKLTGGDRPALEAGGLRVDLGMICREESAHRFEASGGVNVTGTQITGMLAFSGAKLTGRPGAAALQADVLSVTGSIVCLPTSRHRFDASGGMRLRGAHIVGQLRLSGARLTSVDGPALDATDLRVEGSVHCIPAGDHRFEANGGVDLSGAHITRQLGLHGAKLTCGDGPALNATGLRVDEDLLCGVEGTYRFEADGEVRLRGAPVGSQLILAGASSKAAMPQRLLQMVYA